MGESRSVRSTRNILSGLILKTVGYVMTFASKTIFIKVFGVEMLGLNGLFSNVIMLLSLADLGFSTAMAYSYYKPIAENDHEKIAALNHFYKKVYMFIALGITVTGLALIPFLKYIINLENEIEHLYLYYIITLADTVATYLFVYKSTIITANQQTYLINRFSTFCKFASAISQILIMLLFKNYIAYLSVTIVFTLVSNLYVSHTADKQYPYIKEKRELAKEDKKTIFENLKSVFLYKLSSVLLNSTDNIIISKLIGTVSVGYYSNYLMVANMITSYINMMFSSLTASIGSVMAKDSEDKQYTIFKSTQVLSAWICITISSCFYVLVNDFITIWVGERFHLDKYTVLAVAINFFLGGLLNSIWTFREAAGIYRKTKYIMVICAVINLVLSVIMGRYMGLCGVIFASAISRLVTYIWYEPIILFKNYFKKSPMDFFLSSGIIVVLTAATTALLYFIRLQIHMDGVLGFAVKGIACFAAANAVYLLCYCRNKYFKSVVKRIFALAKQFIKK